MIFRRAGSDEPGSDEPGSDEPGFDGLGQAPPGSGPSAEMTFFTEAERACASALLDHLTGQYREPRVPVLRMIEARLAAGQTDGRSADLVLPAQLRSVA
jgi:hypothetical protein